MNYYRGDTKRIILRKLLPTFIYDPISRRASIQRYLKNGKGKLHSADGFHYYKCIFIHIPKTAGLSVCQSIFENYGAGHYRFIDYQNMFSYRFFDDYFKFSIVRNPYNRFESAYYYLKGGGFDKRDNEWANKNLIGYKDINDFVDNWLKSETMYQMVHFCPQTWFLENSAGEIKLDFIGKLENIDNDFQIIKNKLGMKSNLKKINSAKMNPNKIKLNDSSKTKIYELYIDDFKRLGYKK